MTVTLDPRIDAARIDICRAFNAKPKDGIAKLRELCDPQDFPAQAAAFFHANKDNLDLSATGDYVGSDKTPAPAPNDPEFKKKKEEFEMLKDVDLVRSEFANQMNFKGMDFITALRSYSGAFLFPKEGQKLERVLGAFSPSYLSQNPELFKSADACDLLVTEILIVQTTLHTPEGKAADAKQGRPMSLDRFKDELKDKNVGPEDPSSPKTFQEFLDKIAKESGKTPSSISELKEMLQSEGVTPRISQEFQKFLSIVERWPERQEKTNAPLSLEELKAMLSQPEGWKRLEEEDKKPYRWFQEFSQSTRREVNDFDDSFLKATYENISANKLEIKFATPSPALYQLSSDQLANDPTFQKFASLEKHIIGSAPLGVDTETLIKIEPNKPWHSFLTGYSATITIGKKEAGQAKVEITNPGLIGRWFRGEKPAASVKPGDGAREPTQLDIETAAKVTSSFESKATLKATYPYLKEDMAYAYTQVERGKDSNLVRVIDGFEKLVATREAREVQSKAPQIFKEAPAALKQAAPLAPEKKPEIAPRERRGSFAEGVTAERAEAAAKPRRNSI